MPTLYIYIESISMPTLLPPPHQVVLRQGGEGRHEVRVEEPEHQQVTIGHHRVSVGQCYLSSSRSGVTAGWVTSSSRTESSRDTAASSEHTSAAYLANRKYLLPWKIFAVNLAAAWTER